MALETAMKFLTEAGTSEKIQEALKAMEKPQNEEETVKAYLEIAGKFGYDLKAEDITAAIGELKKKQAAATEKALEAEEALSDENLTAVAGGACGDPAFIAGDAQKITCGDALDVVKQAFCITVYW